MSLGQIWFAPGTLPSVRLFEAAACGTPIISDAWDGLDEVIHQSAPKSWSRAPLAECLSYLHDISEKDRSQSGRRASLRVCLQNIRPSRRAEQLENYVNGLAGRAALESEPRFKVQNTLNGNHFGISPSATHAI